MPETVGIEYTAFVPLQTDNGPVIAVGKPGAPITEALLAVPGPQLFTAATVIKPPLKLVAKFTVIPEPVFDVMVAPDGTVHE